MQDQQIGIMPKPNANAQPAKWVRAALPTPLWKLKKSTDFGKKCPDCVHTGVKSLI